MTVLHLLYRDILLAKRTLLLVLPYTVLMTFAFGRSADFDEANRLVSFAAAALIAALIVALTIFGEEEKCPAAGALVCASPYPRPACVLARYLLMGLILLWQVLLSAAYYLLMLRSAPEPGSILLPLLLFLVLTSVSLPVLYRFGVARARWIMMLLVVAVFTMLTLSGQAGWHPRTLPASVRPAILMVTILLAPALSIGCSIHIFQNKEFPDHAKS